MILTPTPPIACVTFQFSRFMSDDLADETVRESDAFFRICPQNNDAWLFCFVTSPSLSISAPLATGSINHRLQVDNLPHTNLAPYKIKTLRRSAN
jgi:hypothetical protein